MNEDLHNEVDAINSIYGDDSLVLTSEENVYILHLPQQSTTMRIQFPLEYPSIPPAVLGTHSSGDHTRKGEGAHVLEIFRDSLGRLFRPGDVCLFDVIEEVNGILEAAATEDEHPGQEFVESPCSPVLNTHSSFEGLAEEPFWTLSDVVIELKSVFVARASPVSSPDQANQYLQHLLDTDKKVRSATHNICAWRVKGENGITYQDCDDDGETAAGGRILHLMQLMDLWGVMVVVTRWYGGHQLGPKRFSIINMVARDALVKGGFVSEGKEVKKKGKR